jgi:hypothetical protein
MDDNLYRTYDAYGKETTPVDVRTALFRQNQARQRAQDMKLSARDRNGIMLPDGWAVYHDGELVFSVDDDKWETIGPAITRIMKPDDDTPAAIAEALTRWLTQAERELTNGRSRTTARDARVVQLLHCARDLAAHSTEGL